ncbi:MAG: Na+/H+ antiporter NhaA [Actinobacteria bacterium]|nr:Na+/H+ antiporter NhaA [Actinomycetota bacterium]
MTTQASSLTGRTAWARSLGLPLRDFLRTESGGAVVLLGAVLVALVWANAGGGSYETFWQKELSIHVGGAGVAETLRGWINDGLMVFFFLVAGLEARRELDMGELRQRRRIALPLVAAAGGMTVPVLIFLAFNAGHSSAGGWGAAMATDTAFALGMLGLVAGGYPRLRTFILTLAVFDDLIALVVIATAYSSQVSFGALGAAVAFFAALLALRAFGVRNLPLTIVLGCATWVALHESGIHPTVGGLALGLALSAYPPMRTDLEQTTALAREFREQPTAELARETQRGITASISANEQVQHALHPWTSYAIVPLFALANAGTHISGDILRHAATSPITLGIIVAYVVGKPVGILAASWLATRRRLGGLQLPVGWATLFGGGAIAGIGFTVSLLVATLAFHGAQLTEAKLGILGAAIGATAVGSLLFGAMSRLPPRLRARLAIGRAEQLVDLAFPVDPDEDHIRGPADAPVTLVEYGDFECPYCGRAEPVLRELLAEFGDELRFVFRDLPLSDVHPRAQLAAEAAEAAAAQGKFWEMHDILFEHQDALTPQDLVRYAEEIGLDVPRFRDELRRRVYAPGVAEDVTGADESNVAGTPTFFVNGRRHHGAYDEESLAAAVRSAWARKRLAN